VSTLFAVNGTLMRGLELNPNLIAAGGEFVREALTLPCYRLWSIGDRHPAMLRVQQGGNAIQLEVWRLPLAAISTILIQEPAGLCVGRVALADKTEVLGVLGEPYLCEEQLEITQWGGWRQYLAAKQTMLPNGGALHA
jgi:hypothetical protein